MKLTRIIVADPAPGRAIHVIKRSEKRSTWLSQKALSLAVRLGSFRWARLIPPKGTLGIRQASSVTFAWGYLQRRTLMVHSSNFEGRLNLLSSLRERLSVSSLSFPSCAGRTLAFISVLPIIADRPQLSDTKIRFIPIPTLDPHVHGSPTRFLPKPA